MPRPKIGACWCVHDDTAFLLLSLKSFSTVPKRFVFVSKSAWHGPAGDWEDAVNIARTAGAEVIVGNWPDESLHRRAALAEMKRRGFDFILIPDGDEVIQAELLEELLKIACSDAADSVRCKMHTFWKGPNYVIRPPEELAPLILLKAKDAEHFHIREYEAGKRKLLLTHEFGALLHLSYAGSNERILRKISSWGHREEVGKAWYDQVWLKWDEDRTMSQLHPTHPHCYDHAERIPVPPELAEAPDPRPHLEAPPVPKRWPSVSVVIPLHGGEEILRNCLESLSLVQDLLHEVIVVDDASPDRAPDIAATYPFVRLLTNEVNIGFGQTCNRGFEASTGEAVVFLNSDTAVPRSGLIRLIETLQSSVSVGAAGPFSNHAGYHQGTRVTYSSLATLDLFAHDFAHRPAKDFEVNMLVGFCLAVRRAAFEELGGFDPRFGIGMFEDNDLCYRLLRAGLKLKVSARAFVHHEGSKSLMERGEHPIQLLERNRKVFQDKWKEDLEFGYASHLSGMGTEKISFNEDRHPDKIYEALRVRAKAADISLCMIVKNEERVLADCLKSIRPFVSQMVVVDTGSNDRTVQIAEEMGAEVHHFPWTDSFSEARNESLRYAKGKWCFWMDADDTMPFSCGVQLLDLALNARPEHTAFTVAVQFVEEGPGGTRVDHVKLFRNHLGIRFEFRIHEQNLASIQEAGGEVVHSDVYVLHSGYDTSRAGQARKRERDYKLLALDLEEQGEHPFTLFCLGMTDHFTGRHERACDWIERSIAAANGQGSQLRKSYALLAGSQRELGRQEEALRTVLAGLEAVGEDPELRFQAGAILSNLGRYEEAKEQYLVMSADTAGYFSSVNVGIFGALREHNLGVAFHHIGDYTAARLWWLKALDRRPLYTESLMALWSVAQDHGDFTTLRKLLDLTLSATGQSALWAQLGCAYAQAIEGEGGPEGFLVRAVAQNPQASAVRLELARLLLSQQRIPEAYPHLMVLTDNGVAEAYDSLCVLAIRQQRFAEALGYIERAMNLDPSNEQYANQAASLREVLSSL